MKVGGIMLKLINIRITDDTIEADYIPEDSSDQAHISMNMTNGSVTVDIIEEYGRMYSRMAVNGLQKIFDELKSKKINEIPNTRLVMWY